MDSKLVALFVALENGENAVAISEKKREALARNAIKAGNANRKHGIHTHLTLDPSRWPARSRHMYERRVLDVLRQPHVDEEVDVGVVAQLGRLEVLLAHAYEYLTARVKQADGLFDDEGNPASMLKTLLAVENTLGRTYDRLLLTPQSRKMFNMKTGQSVALLLSGGGGDDDGPES
jgi:hypothetical protein